MSASTSDVIVPILTGVIGIATGGAGGAWLSTRREHGQWLRQRRMEAYVELIEEAERFSAGGEDASGTSCTSLQNRYAGVVLLGPESVAGAALELINSAMDMHLDGAAVRFAAASRDFAERARGALS